MKRRFSIVIVGMVLSLIFAGAALAKNEAALKAQVQALLDQAAAGFAKKDAQAVAATSVPQAIFKFRHGRTMTLAQWEQETIRELKDWNDLSSRFVVRKAWPMGKGQVGAVYSERHEFTLASDPGHKHVITARFKAVLTKTPQGLRFLEFQELSSKFTRDGKPVPAPGAPKKAKAQG